MILFPAIDLKDGQCVRLVKGEMDRVTVFNDDPADQARAFVQAGFTWIHVVDLNGAFTGEPVNASAVEAVIEAIDMPVQLGGGIRDIETAAAWLEKGISRIVLGTAAVKDPAFVREACAMFPDQVAVGIDARGGRVAVEGWAETSDMLAIDLARAFEDVGVAVIIYTDIDRDGALEGVNATATAELARAVQTPVIASGGVASLADLEVLLTHEADGIMGVISGRAIYDGRLDPTAALALLAG